MRRGTRVGQAYVAITADGSGINDDIADAFDDVDYEQIGRDSEGRYSKGWNKVRENIAGHLKGVDKDFDEMLNRLHGSIVNNREIGRALDKSVASAFDDGRLDELVKEIGRKAGVNFGSEFDHEVNVIVVDSVRNALERAQRENGGLDLSDFLKSKTGSGGGEFDMLGDFVERTAKQVSKAYDDMWDKQERSQKDHVRQVRLGEAMVQDIRERYAKDFARLLDEQDRREAEGLRSRTKFVEKFLSNRQRLLEKSAKAEIKIQETTAKAEASLVKNQQALFDRLRAEKSAKDQKAENDLWAIRQRTYREWVKFDAARARGTADDRGNTVSRNRGDDGGMNFADRVGGMLGAGSRNDAFNIIGKSSAKLVKSLSALTSTGQTMFTTFRVGFSSAGAGANIFQKTLSGAAASSRGALAKLAKSGPAVVAALTVVGFVMSALASVASALVGILVSLTATLVSGLAAALIVGSGLLVAIGAAAGLATLAFTSMTDAQREVLSANFRPLKEGLTGIGQTIVKEMVPAFSKWATNLQKAIVMLDPLAAVMGKAFANVGTNITAALSGPGFQKLTNALRKELPTITENLSKALGDFLNGLTGTFAAIMPYVTRFSEYLADVAERFSKWANSARGQNSIADFLDRAVGSLKSVKRFAKEALGFVSDLLFSKPAQEQGNGMFDSMTESLKGWRRTVKRAIEDGSLERWLKEARKFASDLKVAVIGLKDIFERLDNSKVLDIVGKAVRGVGKAFSFLAEAADVVGKLFENEMTARFEVLTTPVELLADGVTALKDAFNDLKGSLPDLGYLSSLAGALSKVAGAVGSGGGGGGGSSVADKVRDYASGAAQALSPGAALAGALTGDGRRAAPDGRLGPPRNWQDIQKAGEKALNETSKSHGGYKDDESPSGGGSKSGGKAGKSGADDKKKKKKKKELRLGNRVREGAGPGWENPYRSLANALISRAPTLADEMRASAAEAAAVLKAGYDDAVKSMADFMSDLGKGFLAGVGEAATSLDPKAVTDSFQDLITQAGEGMAAAVEAANSEATAMVAEAESTRTQMVSTAQAAVESAARALAGAKTPKEVAAAKKALHEARLGLDLAQSEGLRLVTEAKNAAAQVVHTTTTMQDALIRARAILSQQSVLNAQHVQALTSGLTVENATMADYAEARRQVAERLADATQKLVEATALRDDYARQVTDSARAFGSLMTAQAKVIDGVTQALTVTDITDNMRDRLTKIKKFQSDLRLLLGQGLSQSAYKQLVDAGVEEGGAYAQAILEGGQGSVSEINNLTSEIDNASSVLGTAAASHLYQAGVDAAQGLVDGLLSLSSQLESAAVQLGQTIADAIAAELGIASPSRVLIAMMDNVGDGAVVGLDNQQVKVSAAAARLSDQIAVSPEVAAYAAQQGASANGVSGNPSEPRFLWTGDIVTPTEEPEAVVNEVLNELTGRLP